MEQKKNKKMDYEFDLKKEYRNYKKVGNSESELRNYTQWENHILKEIKKFSREVKINFKHYLIKYKRKYVRGKNIYTSIVVPIYVLFLTFIITFLTSTLNVYEGFNDSMLAIITNVVDIANNYREIIEIVSNNYNNIMNFILIFVVCFVLLLLILVYLGLIIGYNYYSQREDFYNDLIEILEDSIEQDVKK